MRVAEDAMRQAQDAMESEEWRREMEESMSYVREAMENVDTRRLMEESLQQVRDSEESARRALEGARRLVSEGDAGAAFRRALEDAQQAMHSEELRRQLEESLARAQEDMGDANLQRQLHDAMSSLRDSESATRRLLREVQTALPDEAARRQLEHAMEQARQALQGEEWRRQLEESLRHAQEALEQTLAQEMESGLVLEQMRQVLEPVKGRDLRRLALLRASEATQRIRKVGALFRGASFQRVEPGISRHVGVDRGLLVLSLEDDSPLADAGVEPGDVILSVDGRPVDDGGDLFEIVGDRLEALDEDDRAPDSVDLEIHQPSGGRTIRLPLTVASGSLVL
jgi:C-terminal processing protease CtpA/Prc